MPAFPAPGETFGRYEIVRRIGRGGMGTVFEARQLDLGRLVALKLLSPEWSDDPAFRVRFEREARTLASLDSPHIIQVFDSGEQDGVLFIASQLIHGRDLLRLLEESGPLEEQQALSIVAEVASALGDAHEAGILHRDVKPANVLVRESAHGLFSYLCDFGIARQHDSSLTVTSGVIGTLNYMAPECHEGAEASRASDIYSLGCVLWATLSGEAPYDGTSEYQVARAHIESPIPQLVSESPTASAINQVLRRSMAKAPGERYTSAQEMRQALVAAAASPPASIATFVPRPADVDADETRLRGVPTPGPAPSSRSASGSTGGGGSSRRFTRRHHVVAWLGAAATVLVLAGIGFAATRLAGGSEASAGSPDGSGGSSSSSRVTCGDGSTETSAKKCPLPSGSTQMKAVFPSLDGVCRRTEPNQTTKEADPVFDCDYGDFDVRYSSWLHGSGSGYRLEYLNGSYRDPKPAGPKAEPGVRVYEDFSDKAPKLPYVWALAYVDAPYSVIVKARDEQARERGIDYVRISPAGEVPQQ